MGKRKGGGGGGGIKPPPKPPRVEGKGGGGGGGVFGERLNTPLKTAALMEKIVARDWVIALFIGATISTRYKLSDVRS